MLADEPVASLDPAMSRSVLGSLKSAKARRHGATVVCALHQLDYALEFADRIIALRGGKCSWMTIPKRWINRPKPPCMNWQGAPNPLKTELKRSRGVSTDSTAHPWERWEFARTVTPRNILMLLAALVLLSISAHNTEMNRKPLWKRAKRRYRSSASANRRCWTARCLRQQSVSHPNFATHRG
ncbi:MAG: hypothetical protein R3F37_20620 [Candidatus Competibacteraceae bacterium]